jgi:integrase
MMGENGFLDQKQKPINQQIFRQKAWALLLKRLAIRYRPPYQMRHTFATLALSAGENHNWVSRMLGHKSLVMTLERYNRYLPNLTRRDGKALLAAGLTGERFPGGNLN